MVILDEPTRGIDVGAKHEIYNVIYQLAERGCAIVMISSELPEVLGVSDRIVVMRQGRISGELPRKDATEQSVLSLALPQSSTALPETPGTRTTRARGLNIIWTKVRQPVGNGEESSTCKPEKTSRNRPPKARPKR